LNRQVDFLIIGSGIAGLSYALKVAEHGKVSMITKANEDESNTKYAQGGIAAVMYSPDSIEKHVNDTLIAGDGICDKEVVRMVITESTERINELISWGAKFDKILQKKAGIPNTGSFIIKTIQVMRSNALSWLPFISIPI
jgi:L-aspartate oxidase